MCKRTDEQRKAMHARMNSNTVTVKPWFKPTRESGFSKDKTVKENVRKMMGNADDRLTIHNKKLRVLRQANALANVTTDVETEEKARAVVREVSKKLYTPKQF